jgi:hypothetical protein
MLCMYVPDYKSSNLVVKLHALAKNVMPRSTSLVQTISNFKDS